MKKWVVGLIMACMLCIYSSSFAGDVIMFNEDFKDSAAAIKKLNLNPNEWQVSGGVLHSKNTANIAEDSKTIENAVFSVGDANWKDYEVEFKIKRLEINPKDQHFSIFVRNNGVLGKATSGLRLYCRGSAVVFLENVDKKTTRHDFLGNLPKPMEVGEKVPWSTFKISVKDSTAAVYKDGVLIGKVENVVPATGMVAFYAYRVKVDISDLKVTVYSTSDKKQELKASNNIFPNSSFEFCTQDDLPDYWGCRHWGISAPYYAVHFDEWIKNYGTDTSTAFDGKRSIRINNPFNKPDMGALCLRSQSNLGPNGVYTISAYMKSAVPGMKISLAGKDIVLTTEWQRYSTVLDYNGAKNIEANIDIYPLEKGTFWVDAVQMEAGDALTPYAASLQDTILAAQFGESKVAFDIPEESGAAYEKQHALDPGKTVALDVPEAKPVRISQNIILDGRLDKPIWMGMPELSFHLIKGGVPQATGFAKLLYSDQGIYIGIYCQDVNAKQNVCARQKRDDEVWNDPSVEVFMDPWLSRSDYYHFVLNQANVQFDAKNQNASWNFSWKSATYTGDGYWSAEIFLPFGEMGIDGRVGEWWGINICINNSTTKENICWSPTFGGFHSPERFGRIFLDNSVLDNYRVYLNDAQIQSLPSGENTLALQIVNASSVERTVEAQADFKSNSGKTVKLVQKAVIPASGAKKIALGDFSMEPGTEVPCGIILKSVDKGITINSSARTITSMPVMEVMAQYDRYTSEPEILARVKLNLSEVAIKDARLFAEVSGNGKVVLSKEFTKLSDAATYIKLPGISKLPIGDYALSVKCLDKKGKCLAVSEEKIRKLAPSACEVKIDRIRRTAVVGSKPFFPVGHYWEGYASPELLEYLAANGSNTIDVYISPSTLNWESYIASVLDNAKKYGLMVRIHMGGYNKDWMLKVVQEFRQHPALLAWLTFDEVFSSVREWGRKNYDFVVETLKEISETDPYHPAMMNECYPGIAYLKDTKLDFPGDVVSLDYYAFPPSGNIAATADYLKLMQDMGKKDGRPSWIYIFSSGYAFIAPREFTPAEQEYSTYLSVVSGAKGVSYFASHPKSKSNWSAICRLMREIRELTPALVSPLEVPVVECSSPAIKFTVRKHDGAIYLIAVNGSKGQVSATFDLSGATALKGGAEVLFEGRKATLKNNVLADTFAGYQRHVYKIEFK
jgi:hypothetical protein